MRPCRTSPSPNSERGMPSAASDACTQARGEVNPGSSLVDTLLDCKLDHVAFSEVVHAVDGNATLEARTDFAHVFRLTLDSTDGRILDDVFTTTSDTRLGITPGFTIADVASGDLAALEDLTHFRHADHLVFVDRFEQALERLFHVFEQLVDHAIDADLDAIGFSQPLRRVVCFHVEADDDGLRRDSEIHVVLGDVARFSVQNLDTEFVCLPLRNLIDDRFERPLYVHFQDQ